MHTQTQTTPRAGHPARQAVAAVLSTTRRTCHHCGDEYPAADGCGMSPDGERGAFCSALCFMVFIAERGLAPRLNCPTCGD